MKDASVSNIKVRDMELTVEVSGFGSKVEAFFVDGEAGAPFLAWDGQPHEITIHLA